MTFFFCGQMIKRKGVDLLLLAFDRLVTRGIDARLLLVGREADLPKFLATVGHATRSKVCYEGFQPPERLPEYFGKSDVFVLPSRHDGWGVVINQALAAGLPIITSNAVGAGLDLVENGVNGMRIAANDVDGLYCSMEMLASNPEVARQWGERSREKARDLTPEAGAEKWVRVFESVRTHRLDNPAVDMKGSLLIKIDMRILLVSSGSGSRGGGEIFLDYLGKGLTDRGHEVLMWIPNHPRMDELAEQMRSICADSSRQLPQYLRLFRALALDLLQLGGFPSHRARVGSASTGCNPYQQTKSGGRPRSAARSPALRAAERLHHPSYTKCALPSRQGRLAA